MVFYCVRCFGLLFVQEFPIDELLVLWDFLFAHFNENVVTWTICVCVALIVSQKQRIMHIKSPNCLRVLFDAKYNVAQVISTAQKVYRKAKPVLE